MDEKSDYIKGRGSQINTANRFNKNSYVQEHIEGLDEPWETGEATTQIFYDYPKQIVNKIESPDTYGEYSMNPYQGCEHGCIYCYARNTHEYWGFSAGLDFERKIMAKPDAAKLLEATFQKPSWKSAAIMLSGNTDCYQPIERKLKITRGLLEVLLKYRNPVGMITKNSLILRDLDLLKELARLRLVHVMVSITSLKEDLRRVLEPRTASWQNRLKVLETLSKNGISCGVMTAPIIPALNSEEIPALIKAAADHGAVNSGYTIVRLNGAVEHIFKDWLEKNFPDRAHKVWEQIKECHGGKVSDHRFGKRMRGEGNIAEMIKRLHQVSVAKYMHDRKSVSFDYEAFYRPEVKNQGKLF
jgi:DNA repair photolyase